MIRRFSVCEEAGTFRWCFTSGIIMAKLSWNSEGAFSSALTGDYFLNDANEREAVIL